MRVIISRRKEIADLDHWTIRYEDYEERKVGGSERHYRWGEQNISSVLKVPRHCPFVLLVSVSF
jgi:hypothetical protein